jgi:hypothetical protein
LGFDRASLFVSLVWPDGMHFYCGCKLSQYIIFPMDMIWGHVCMYT